MFCPKCGKEIPDGSSFCPYCGAKITTESISAKEKQVRKKNLLLVLIPIAIVVIALSVFFLPIAPKPLVGKWQAFSIYDSSSQRYLSSANMTFEFLNDGTYVSSTVDSTLSGIYVIVDKNHISLMTYDYRVRDNLEFSISGDVLTLVIDSTEPKYIINLRRTK